MNGIPPKPRGRPAVVLGLCAHGLATARSLWRSGVPVHALEQSRLNPGCRTKSAVVHFVEDINGEGLIEALIDLHRSVGFSQRPVLFPINDNMVRTLGNYWERLNPLYLLSWSSRRETLLPLLNKINLEERCRTAGLHCPQANHLYHVEELEGLADGLAYPLLIKPDRPLSSFKTKLVHSFAELNNFIQAYRHDLPVLLQQWIPGNDCNLVFGGLYLEEGRVLAHYEGRKLRVVPEGTGWSTIGESCPEAGVFRETTRFFDGLELSGPVSVEFKRSESDGRLWFIEATVGRTDFWLPCSIVNGIDFPLLSYCRQCNIPAPTMQQRRDVLFYNTPQDPLALLHAIGIKKLAILSHKAAFPFFALDDPGPFYAGIRQRSSNLFRAVNRRLKRLLIPATQSSE